MENEYKGKVYPYQKVVQAIFDVNGSIIEGLRYKIQKHADRVLYNYAEAENFNIYRGQVVLSFENNRNITTCLNGRGVVKRIGKNQTGNTNVSLKLWNEMDVVGIARTSLDTTNIKRQQQINVIVHGDVAIHNNGPNHWFPNQRLIVSLPSSRLDQSIRFDNLPEHGFYPIVESYNVHKHTRHITDLMHHYLTNDEQSNTVVCPKWVQDMARKQWELDIMRGWTFPDNQIKKYKDDGEQDSRTAFYLFAFDTKDETAKIQANRDLMANHFVQYEKARAILDEKVVGKVVISAEVGNMGTVVINNSGTSIYTHSVRFHIDDYIDSLLQKKRNDLNDADKMSGYGSNFSEDEL